MNNRRPEWLSNGVLKQAACIAAVIFALGGGWTKLDAIQTSMDGLTNRVANMEKVLMEK